MISWIKDDFIGSYYADVLINNNYKSYVIYDYIHGMLRFGDRRENMKVGIRARPDLLDMLVYVLYDSTQINYWDMYNGNDNVNLV